MFGNAHHFTDRFSFSAALLQRLVYLLLVVLLAVLPMSEAMAAITFRDSSQAGVAATDNVAFGAVGGAANGPSGNVTPGLPGGTAAGHFLLCLVESRDNVAHAMAGWTQLYTDVSGLTHRASLFYRVATAVNPTTVTHTGGARIVAQIIRFTGVDTVDPFDTVNSLTVSPADLTTEAASISTTTANSMLVFAAHMADAYTTLTISAGGPLTQRFNSTTGGMPGTRGSIAVFTDLRLATGVQAAVTMTRSGGPSGPAVSHGALIALRPANLKINVPALTALNDVMIASIGVRPSTLTINPPAGWTQVVNTPQPAGNSQRQATYVKVATATEPASYTWTFSGASTGAVGGIISFSGVDTATPVNAFGGNVTPSALTHTANSITTTVTNTMLVASHTMTSAVNWCAPDPPCPPAEMTEAVDVASLGVPNIVGISIEMSYLAQAAAGATGNRTATASGFADTGTGHQVALRPAISVDHYAMSHSGLGVTCEAEPVTVTAHDALHAAVAPGTSTTMTINTSTGLGDWAISGGTGTFNNGTANDGIATYQFGSGETSVALFLSHTTPATTPDVDIDIVDNNAITDNNGDPAEDAVLEFVDAAFRFYAGDGVTQVANTLGTQIAGKESNLAPGNQVIQLRAVQTNTDTGACEARITGAQAVEMGFECDNPTSCQAGERVQIDDTTDLDPGNNQGTITVSAGNYDSVSLDFGVTGTAAFTLDYSDAGRIRLHARKALAASGNDPAFTLYGPSNYFIVRPFGFDIDSDGKRAADWGDDSTLNGTAGDNTYAADATGTAFMKAGASFNATVRAVVWAAADDGDNNGVPDAGANLTNNAATPNFGEETATELVNVTRTVVRPAAPGDPGMLTGGSNLDLGGGSGALTTTMNWDEVGVINLAAVLVSGDYLASGADVTATHQNFGRFYPDRFAIVDNGPAFANACTLGVTPFTYQDQAFYYGTGTAPVLTVTALNEGGGVTENYGGGTGGVEGFWKLNSTLARTYTDQAVVAATFAEVQDATATLTNHTDFDGDGTLALDDVDNGDAFIYARVSEEAQFSADVDLGFTAVTLTDGDGACYDPTNDGTCDAYVITGVSGTDLRFGRLIIGTAAGSELLPLSVPVRTEYFDGTAFITNTDDACTLLAVTDLDLDSAVEAGQTDGDVDISNGAGCAGTGVATATIANTPFVNGDAGLSFSVASPAAGCTGYADVTLDLGAIPLTIGAITYPDMTFLQYDWADADGLGDGPYDENPAGRATFGIFAGPQEFIYIREPW